MPHQGKGRPRSDASAPGASGDPDALARTICLRLLARAPRTRAQLADALDRRGVPVDAAARVLDQLCEIGLIDDVAFAAAWVETRHHGRGLARPALAAELRHRGVADDVTRAAVAGLDPDRELTTARDLVVRRRSAMSHLDPSVQMRRLVAMLTRRGYSAAIAFRLVRQVLEEDGVGQLPDIDVD